jgi:hypothetical protein
MSALGIGNSATKYTPLLGEYENKYGLLFDGTNDYLLGGITGHAPANGTVKPISPSGFTVAAWCKLDIDGVSDSYNETSAHVIVSTSLNGGWVLKYENKRFTFRIKLVDGDGNFAATAVKSTFAMMRNDGNDKRFLHREDGWHFVVGTWDGDRVKNLYVDGGRDVAGSQGGSGTPDYGSMLEDADSKETESAPSGGAYTIKYDTANDRDEIDLMIGTSGTYNAGTNVTSSNIEFWEGYIGDIGIWDKELTSAEITALYNLHTPTDMSKTQPDNLQAYYKMEEGSGTALIDSTGKVGAAIVGGVKGTIHGAAFSTVVPTTDVSGYPNYQ